MVTQHSLGRLHALHHRNRPGPWARRTMWLANIWWQRFSFVHHRPRTFRLERRWSPFLGRCGPFPWTLAPSRIHKLAVIAVTETMAGCVIPDIGGGRSVDIGLATFKGEFVGHGALKIVGSLAAAICDLPGFLVVVASNGGGGPVMAVARDLSAVIKVVEHAKLQRQLMLVRGNVLTIESQRGIAVAHFEVAEHLVISAILFNDVDHIANRIRATSELNASRIRVE